MAQFYKDSLNFNYDSVQIHAYGYIQNFVNQENVCYGHLDYHTSKEPEVFVTTNGLKKISGLLLTSTKKNIKFAGEPCIDFYLICYRNGIIADQFYVLRSGVLQHYNYYYKCSPALKTACKKSNTRHLIWGKRVL